MKTLAFLEKTFLENLREWKILILTLVFTPFFVYLMYGYFKASPTTYTLLVKNNDPAAVGLVRAWIGATHPNGSPMFAVKEVTDIEAASRRVASRDADLLIEIPAGFAAALDTMRGGPVAVPPRLLNRGTETNPRSSIAMALSDYVAFSYAFAAAGTTLPFDVAVERVGSTRELSEFDLYVPGLLVLSLIMVLFTAAATLIKEVDKGTMIRLVLSKLTTIEFLTAVLLNQVLIGTVALLLAFASAWSVGYRPQGSLVAMTIVGALSTMSVMAIAVLVAAFLNTIFELLTVGCFPFFVLMFFSDSMFPLPKIQLFHLAGNAVNLNDVLPTAITTRAFNRILNQDAGLGDLLFEMGAIAFLTVVYFAAGAWWFRRRHQSAA
jgi:ABC-2 type transport system permease protein